MRKWLLTKQQSKLAGARFLSATNKQQSTHKWDTFAIMHNNIFVSIDSNISGCLSLKWISDATTVVLPIFFLFESVQRTALKFVTFYYIRFRAHSKKMSLSPHNQMREAKLFKRWHQARLAFWVLKMKMKKKTVIIISQWHRVPCIYGKRIVRRFRHHCIQYV